MTLQFTSEFISALPDAMDKPPFTAEQLAEMSSEARALVAEQAAPCRQYPVNATDRLAAESLTRRCSTGAEFNPEQKEGCRIRLADDGRASVLIEGCSAVCSDGTRTRIVSSAGKRNRLHGRDVALAGSRTWRRQTPCSARACTTGSAKRTIRTPSPASRR